MLPSNNEEQISEKSEQIIQQNEIDEGKDTSKQLISNIKEVNKSTDIIDENSSNKTQDEDLSWEEKIIREIKNLKNVVESKADKNVVDQIHRYQDEVLNLRKSNTDRVGLLDKSTTDPEIICHDCIDNGDMESAFLTVLKYVETVSATKAESIMVEDKASRAYVDNLFNRLNVITRQQITEANSQLKQKLQSRLNSLVNEFDQFSAAVEKRMRYCEMEIIKLEDTIENSRLVTKKAITGTYYHSPVNILTEKQAPAPRKMYYQIPKTQPMRAIVNRGDSHPNFVLSSNPLSNTIIWIFTIKFM